MGKGEVDMTKKEMLGQMEELRSTCVDICTNLWNNPESGGNEQKSADMIRELLHHEGIRPALEAVCGRTD